MRRRAFITLLGGVAVAPLAARAQTPKRVGVLMNGAATEDGPKSNVDSFVRGLRNAGWIEGQTIRIDVRWSAGDAQLARIYAAQLIGLQPDALLVASTTNLEAIRAATNTVPVVYVQVSDPVAQGYAESLNKPGGNMTGFSQYEFAIAGKWLGLLKEAAPDLARISLFFNPDTSPQSRYFFSALDAAARSLHMQAVATQVRATNDIDAALKSLANGPKSGIILPTDTFTRMRQPLIIERCLSLGLPSISAIAGFAQDGGLMDYGTNSTSNLIAEYARAAGYVDRILKGAKPGDLPVQLADKHSLSINLKTAKALGLTIPLPLSGLADELVE